MTTGLTVSTWTGWVEAEAATSGWLVIPLTRAEHPTMIAVRDGRVIAVFVKGSRSRELSLDQRAWVKHFLGGGQTPNASAPLSVTGPLSVLLTGPEWGDKEMVREMFA